MGNPLRLLALLLGSCIPLHAYDVPGFAPDQTIAYKQTTDSGGGPVTLNLDVFTPEGHRATDRRPAIVFFFGGGWVSGSSSHFHPHCEYLAARGMVAVSAEYRIRNEHGTTPRECVKDGKSAVRYLRENAASLGIDPDRIAAGGGSAGGHVAAAAGTLTGFEERGENLAISSKPDALVLFNPVYDNGPGGYGHNRVKDYWEDFSPLHNIDATTPPAAVFLGTADHLVPAATARNFKALMEAEGIRSDLHLYQDQPHGFFNYDVPDDGSGPFHGYRDTVFKTDEFLVSLGYLDGPNRDPEPVTDWKTIFGDAGFAAASEATASPATTDADGDAIAADFDPRTLADGDFLRLSGSASFDAPLSGANFRIGLFAGDAPVTAGDGSGYGGIWAEAPATSDTNLVAGDGSGRGHPFETTAGTVLGPIPAADETVPADTPVDFTLTIARNGDHLDLSTRFADQGAYVTEQNLLNQPVAEFDYDRVALLMSADLDATQAAFSNIGVSTGRVLAETGPADDPDDGGADPTDRAITYVDAVEGASGNTFATGSSPDDTSWESGLDSSSLDENQWTKRTTVEGNGDTLFQALHSLGDGHDMPELTTRIAAPGDGTYDVWAFYWDQIVSDTQNWTLSAGLVSGALNSYSSPGEPAVTGATAEGVYNAADLTFTNPVQTVAGGGLRNLFGVYLGQVTVSGEAPIIEVHVDNLLGGGSNHRSWFDGVGYARVNDFASWIEGFEVGDQTGFQDDPDGDGKPNGLENFFGTDPGRPDGAGLTATSVENGAGHSFIFTHPQNATPAEDLSAAYQWSVDLESFFGDGVANGDGTTVTFSTAADTPAAGTTSVTATATGATIPDRLFVKLQTTQSSTR